MGISWDEVEEAVEELEESCHPMRLWCGMNQEPGRMMEVVRLKNEDSADTGNSVSGSYDQRLRVTCPKWSCAASEIWR